MNNFKINLTKRLKPYSKYIPGINKAMMRSHFKCKKSSSADSENLGSFSDEIFVFSEKLAEFWEIYQNIHLFIEILVCVAFLEHSKYSKGAFDKEVARLSAAFPDEPNDHDMYCTILMILLETFLQYKRPVDDLADILRELKFKEECVEDLAKVMISNQQSLTEQFHEMKTPKPLEKFQYKINISLMESGQPPTVILHQEHEGETKTFNLSLKQFHRLRLGVASSLAEIQSLETKRS